MDLDKAYHVLDIPSGAAEKDVRAAFKDLVIVWHPDRFQKNERLRVSAERKLKEINAAFETISAAGFPSSCQAHRKPRTPLPGKHISSVVSHDSTAATCPKCGSVLIRLELTQAREESKSPKTALICEKCKLFSEPTGTKKCCVCGKAGYVDSMHYEVPTWGADKPWVEVEPHTIYWHSECAPRGNCPVCGKAVKGECMAVGRTLGPRGTSSAEQTRHLGESGYWKHGVGVRFYHMKCRPQYERADESSYGSPGEIGKTARLCHLAGLFGFVIGPLVVWLTKRKRHPFIDQHGKEAITFQINVLIGLIFIIVMMKIGIVGRWGALILAGIVVYDVVKVVQAAAAALRMETYEYPFINRFMK
jgi:uncharacterized protein